MLCAVPDTRAPPPMISSHFLRARLPGLLRPLTLAVAALSPATHAADELNVAYFLEWPTPNLVAKADGAFEAALGVPVNWTAFDTGTQMTEAFIAGEIDLAYSQGLAPFITAVNVDLPIVAVGTAVQYPANDCVVRDGSAIDRDRPSTLEGSTVAVPLATMADYSFRLMLRELGVDASRVSVLDRIPNDGAVALGEGEVDMACGFGAVAMARMLEAGQPLMSAQDKAAAGIVSFDVVSVDRRFARENTEMVRRFLEVTHAANAAWTASPEQLAKVAAESGLDVTGVLTQLADFTFPSVAVQRRDLFGVDGLAVEAMNLVGDAFASDGGAARDDYADTIDASYLR